MNILKLLLVILPGGYAFYMAYTRNPSFFEHPKARPIVRLMGINGARWFYMILGALLIGIGIFAAINGKI
ncbi:MAG: hypothetical protein ACOYXC_15865 [Candidatus Rifleibacteriota bacterium]